jgi:hypothetical protein
MKKKYYIKIGEKYGKWTVLNNHIKHIKPSGETCYLNLCRCECGKESLRDSITLFRSTLKGCFSCCKKGRKSWNKGKTMPTNMKEIMKIKMKGKHNSPRTQFKKGMIPWNKGGKMPQITGENNYLWREDREQINLGKKRWCSKECAEWRQQIFTRDNFKCKINNKDCKGRLEAHHILPWVNYPELRFDINNGITLCHAHHPRKKDEVAKLSPYFKELVAEK